MKPTIDVTIRSQDGVLSSGPAKAVSSTNSKGYFDVLPHHEHFVGIVEQVVVVHHIDGTDQEFKIDKAIMSVWEDKVFIYLKNQ